MNTKNASDQVGAATNRAMHRMTDYTVAVTELENAKSEHARYSAAHKAIAVALNNACFFDDDGCGPLLLARRAIGAHEHKLALHVQALEERMHDIILHLCCDAARS